jgi:uncharacterized phiE125 gp8 family phage protein
MTISIVTPAATDPVTLAEIKSHCRVTISDDDTYLLVLVKAATDWVQHRTGRQLVTATLRQSWDSYPSMFYPPRVISQIYGPRVYFTGLEATMMTLDVEPVASVTSVTYYDPNDALQTVTSTDYWVDVASTPPRVVPKNAWPNIYFGRPSAFRIDFVAGYGVATDVPVLLKQAVMLLAAHWYERREASIVGTIIAPVPMTVDAICQRYATRWV